MLWESRARVGAASGWQEKAEVAVRPSRSCTAASLSDTAAATVRDGSCTGKSGIRRKHETKFTS